jgi:hypothetical protein
VEEVHEHRLAAADGPPDIEALHRRRLRALAEQPAERAALARELALCQRLGESDEPPDDDPLGRVFLDGARCDERVDGSL